MLRNVDKASQFDRSFGRAKAKEKGRELWVLEGEEHVGSVLLMTVSTNLGRYRLDLQGVQEVTCNKVCTEQAKDYILRPGTDVNVIN